MLISLRFSHVQHTVVWRSLQFFSFLLLLTWYLTFSAMVCLPISTFSLFLLRVFGLSLPPTPLKSFSVVSKFTFESWKNVSKGPLFLFFSLKTRFPLDAACFLCHKFDGLMLQSPKSVPFLFLASRLPPILTVREVLLFPKIWYPGIGF